MSGDKVWIAKESIFGLGNTLPDGFTAATPLGQLAQGGMPSASICDMVTGLIPGSIGETSVIAIAIGAVILLWTGIASWKTMGSVFAGGIVMALIFQALGMTPIAWYEHIILGGFCFGAVFMATDPVTSARTEKGKYFVDHLVTDRPFWVDSQRCVKCGICADVCPVHDVLGGLGYEPQWRHDGSCLSCFTCYHHCPHHAIEYGRQTKHKGQYFFKKR